MNEILQAVQQGVEAALRAIGIGRKNKTYRTGNVRNMDNLGRYVIDMDIRKLCGLQPGDAMMQTLEVDPTTGRMTAIRLEPVAWALNPQEAPEYTRALARAANVTGEGPEVEA